MAPPSRRRRPPRGGSPPSSWPRARARGACASATARRRRSGSRRSRSSHTTRPITGTAMCLSNARHPLGRVCASFLALYHRMHGARPALAAARAVGALGSAAHGCTGSSSTCYRRCSTRRARVAARRSRPSSSRARAARRARCTPRNCRRRGARNAPGGAARAVAAPAQSAAAILARRRRCRRQHDDDEGATAPPYQATRRPSPAPDASRVPRPGGLFFRHVLRGRSASSTTSGCRAHRPVASRCSSRRPSRAGDGIRAGARRAADGAVGVAFIEAFEDDLQLLLGPLGYALATVRALNVIASVAPPLARSPVRRRRRCRRRAAAAGRRRARRCVRVPGVERAVRAPAAAPAVALRRRARRARTAATGDGAAARAPRHRLRRVDGAYTTPFRRRSSRSGCRPAAAVGALRDLAL